MKKLNKKLLVIGLAVLFFSVSIGFLVKAQDDSYFFNVDSATTTPPDVKNSNGVLIKVINRSGKNYFVPNKTIGEWNSFKNNAPKYVSISECGDGVCSEGETEINCNVDCNSPTLPEYCGDGTCRSEIKCATTTIGFYSPSVCEFNRTAFFFWPLSFSWLSLTGQNLLWSCTNGTSPTDYIECKETLEDWNSCPDDCLPKREDGCGVCGYSGSGQLCPNWCNGGASDFTNCVVGGNAIQVMPNLAKNNNNNYLRNLFGTPEALAFTYRDRDQPYYISQSWGCDYSQAITPCQAGKYCTPGGLASDTMHNCPSGYFCVPGSRYPRTCPPDTWSYQNSDKCNACPPGTASMPGSKSPDSCLKVYQGNDTVCQYDVNNPSFSENPRNSFFDCPDKTSNSGSSWQRTFYGDGLCSGVETRDVSSPYYSSDCGCGDGICQPEESYQSCYADCACGNGICDSIYNPLRPFNISGSDIDETRQSCPQDCGNDGICDSVERNNRNLYINDCHCGNSICEAAYNEQHYNCPNDCKCGNSICEAGENFNNCPFDCRCGNSICEVANGENFGNCTDCTNIDGVCDPYEASSSHMAMRDCHCGRDADFDNNMCDTGHPYYETTLNCPDDCNSTGGYDPKLPRIPYDL